MYIHMDGEEMCLHAEAAGTEGLICSVPWPPINVLLIHIRAFKWGELHLAATPARCPVVNG